MTKRSLATKPEISNHVVRRGLLAGMSLLAVSATAAAAVPAPSPAPTSIVAMATRIAAIVDRENFLDNKGLSALTPGEEAEEGRLYDERIALQNAIIATAPGTITEALIVLMHAADRINFGNWHEDTGDTVEQGERAIRGATFVLSRELGTSLLPLGGESFLPPHMCSVRSGRA